MSYEALSTKTFEQRLRGYPEIASVLGRDHAWEVKEIGDGNLNLVFIARGIGSVVVKQALPYVRLIGDSWPLPLKRSFFEWQALQRLNKRAPGQVPRMVLFDEAQALVAMEYLEGYRVLRHALLDGQVYSSLGDDLGRYLARSLFRGSDFSLPASEKRHEIELFESNVELCAITEDLVFTDPYWDAPMNKHSVGLEPIVEKIRADGVLKAEVQFLKHRFLSHAETLLHGDLHTGSVMIGENQMRVIDPEFAVYGPFGFDIGMLLGNLWMSFFSQRAHASTSIDCTRREHDLIQIIAAVWSTFRAEFASLFRTERNGSLFDTRVAPAPAIAAAVLGQKLDAIWFEALGFAGVEIIRRIIGMAHNADFETITDISKRTECERQALDFAVSLIKLRMSLTQPDDATDLAVTKRMGK